MKNNKPEVVILGAGPAGLAAALQLTRRGLAKVMVLERSDRVGGIAGGFQIEGLAVDYGSHRLHPACDPEILEDIRELLGDDLLDRPRHGRIRLRNRWVHFPLKPLDLIFKLPPSFALGTAANFFAKILPRKSAAVGPESFASVLEEGLGKTICREFYFPYAEKIWGLSPEKLSPAQAHRRVSSNSFKKLASKMMGAVPGFRTSTNGRFYYPKKGFAQIIESLYQEARRAGAEFCFSAQIKSLNMNERTIVSVLWQQNAETITLSPDYLWSTIPISALLKSVQPQIPLSVLKAVDSIHYRGMILIYLTLAQERFTEYDAHYFPESHVPIMRLSEPKNYSKTGEPYNKTVLCAELPCDPSDTEWNMSDEDLGRLVLDCLQSVGLPVWAKVTGLTTRRIREAYPVYPLGYEATFNDIDQWIMGVENLITFGRQGLFVHDNIHHALKTAYCAVSCLNDDGSFDRTKWQGYRRIFETYVVED